MVEDSRYALFSSVELLFQVNMYVLRCCVGVGGEITHFVNYDLVPNSHAALLRTSLLVCPPGHLVPAKARLTCRLQSHSGSHLANSRNRARPTSPNAPHHYSYTALQPVVTTPEGLTHTDKALD